MGKSEDIQIEHGPVDKEDELDVINTESPITLTTEQVDLITNLEQYIQSLPTEIDSSVRTIVNSALGRLRNGEHPEDIIAHLETAIENVDKAADQWERSSAILHQTLGILENTSESEIAINKAEYSEEDNARDVIINKIREYIQRYSDDSEFTRIARAIENTIANHFPVTELYKELSSHPGSSEANSPYQRLFIYLSRNMQRIERGRASDNLNESNLMTAEKALATYAQDLFDDIDRRIDRFQGTEELDQKLINLLENLQQMLLSINSNTNVGELIAYFNKQLEIFEHEIRLRFANDIRQAKLTQTNHKGLFARFFSKQPLKEEITNELQNKYDARDRLLSGLRFNSLPRLSSLLEERERSRAKLN